MNNRDSAVTSQAAVQEARDAAYNEVSVRAVELLARAQRAADDAVQEAQAYARDLEESAREQYRTILQRAHEAARIAAPGATSNGDAAVPDGPVNRADAEQVRYVQTYAKVAHNQLRAVLGVLTDELDRLAELAADPVTERPPSP